MLEFFLSGVLYSPACNHTTMRQLMEHCYLSGTVQRNVQEKWGKEGKEMKRRKRKEKIVFRLGC